MFASGGVWGDAGGDGVLGLGSEEGGSVDVYLALAWVGGYCCKGELRAGDVDREHAIWGFSTFAQSIAELVPVGVKNVISQTLADGKVGADSPIVDGGSTSAYMRSS